MTLRPLIVAMVLAWASAAQAYPVTVRSCFESATFKAAPRRPVVNDANMVQTVIDLGLADRFVAFGGIRGVEDKLIAPPAMIARIKQRELGANSPSLEQLLGINPDFYFGGWFYGFGEGTGITPAELSRLGIGSYLLTESCVRVGKRPPITMDVMYADLYALGRIFGIEPRASALVDRLKRRVKAVTDRTRLVTRPSRVMYCGACTTDAAPLTIGADGMPKLLAQLAGGRNIFDDVAGNYVQGSWEAVIARDPEWIIVSDHKIRADEQIRYLTTAPTLRNVTAIRKRQFVPMTLAERAPSPRNVDALERLARAMHPELFRR